MYDEMLAACVSQSNLIEFRLYHKMAFLTRLLWRFLYFCALCFVSLSVVYTTEFLFLFSMASSRHFATLPKSDLPATQVPLAGLKRTISEQQLLGGPVASGENLINISQPALPLTSQRGLVNRASRATAPSFGWASSEFTLKHGLGHPGTNMVDERTMLSKAFATSMRPSNVLPYFYRASGSFEKDDITITTLVTSNRFEVLARLVKKYKGPLRLCFFFLCPVNQNSLFRTDFSHRSHQGYQTAR